MMVYVRIELWPSGDRERAQLLQELVIANDGTGTERVGTYRAAVSHSTTFKGSGFADPVRPTKDEIWRTARGISHVRRRSPAHLVLSVLSKLLP